MNRRQRRRLQANRRVLERVQSDLVRDRARLLAEARSVAESLRALDAPREARLALADRAIASMDGNPLTRLVAKDALAELRRVRTELAGA